MFTHASMTSIVLGTIALDKMAGGLEKNIVLLANHFARCGKRVSLVTFDTPGVTAFYDLNPSVEWHQVGRTKPHAPIGFWERLALIGRIRSIVKNMDRPVVVCFHHGILPRFYLACLLLGVRLVCSERNSISLYQHIRQAKWSLGFMMLTLADRITVQFPGYVRDYPMWLRRRIRVIPNPVYAASGAASPQLPGPDGRYKLLTVGRICAQKNQQALVSAFAEVCHAFPEWDLHIVGDGEATEDLAAFIRARDIAGRVFLHGKQRDVPAWLKSAHLFCMPSRWEGFPNALAEAMAHGLPCIGLNSCAGVRDLISDGITGRLVAVDELQQPLRELMGDPALRAAMGKASKERISRYRPEDTFRRWDELMAELELSR